MWLLQKISYLPFVMTAPHGLVSLSFSTMDLKPFRNLVWIIMILMKKIITFVQILTKSNIRGKSCEILWGLKFTYLEKLEFTKFWIRIDKCFELIVVSSAFSLSYSSLDSIFRAESSNPRVVWDLFFEHWFGIPCMLVVISPGLPLSF